MVYLAGVCEENLTNTHPEAGENLMTEVEALVSLNMVGEIGTIRLKRLLAYFGQPENILKAPQEKLTVVFGIGEKIAQKIHALKKENLEKEFALVKKLGLKIITQDDQVYPENLKNIYDPPMLLYVKGELKPEDKLCFFSKA